MQYGYARISVFSMNGIRVNVAKTILLRWKQLQQKNSLLVEAYIYMYIYIYVRYIYVYRNINASDNAES